MIQLNVTMTGKGYSPKDGFRCFDKRVFHFKDMGAAREYLKETYGKAKRSPMYLDTKEGTKKVGYIFGFRNADLSHYPVEKWIQNDWVEFREVKTITI